jgi:hypothetical protein
MQCFCKNRSDLYHGLLHLLHAAGGIEPAATLIDFKTGLARFSAVSAMANPRAARLRMQAANIGAAFIDVAAARLRIEIHAIAAGAPGHREQALLVIEMIDQAIFQQALGNATGRLMLRFKRIDPTKPHELRQSEL